MSLPADRPEGANPPVVHPGPANPERVRLATTRTRPVEVALAAGDDLEAAILRAFVRADCASGWVRMDGLRCEPLRYVVPAEAESAARFAGYSAPVQPEGPGEILRGYMSVGRDSAGGSSHCHGVWRHADGTEALGHLLARECVVAAPARLHATGFLDAGFLRRPDPETGFDLFTVEGDTAAPAEAIVLTLGPNESLPRACRAACARCGIAGAEVVGLGSLNGARFRDGRRMRSAIDEFVIRRGRVGRDGSDLFDIEVVDVDGARFAGPLDPDDATVSITAELVILPDAAVGPAP